MSINKIILSGEVSGEVSVIDSTLGRMVCLQIKTEDQVKVSANEHVLVQALHRIVVPEFLLTQLPIAGDRLYVDGALGADAILLEAGLPAGSILAKNVHAIIRRVAERTA